MTVCTLNHQLTDRQAHEVSLGHSQPADIQFTANALRDDRRIGRKVFDVCPVEVRRFDVGLHDGGYGGGERRDRSPVDLGFIDVRRRDLSLGDCRNLRCKVLDLCPVDLGIDDIRCGQLCGSDHGNGGIEFICRDAPCCELFDFGGHRCERIDVQHVDERFSDVRTGDAGILNVRGADGSVTNLQAAHRSGLQLSGTHGVERQLCAGDATAGKLAGRHHAAFQRISHRAQRDRGVPACQAVVGILRHAHGHFHADAPGDDPHTVAEEDIGKRSILAVFLGIRAVHEVHLEGDGRQVAALVVLSLCCLPHEREAFLSASGFITVRDFFGLGH